MKKRWLVAVALLIIVFALSACRKDQAPELTEEEAAQLVQEATEQIDSELEAVLQEEDSIEQDSDILQDFTGEMELAGNWQDEISQRASMVIAENDDGSYDIKVTWGSSAFETSTWEIHGAYDTVSGMLSYDDGVYTVHTFDEQGSETVSEEVTTAGAFLKEGDKLRWNDSKAVSEGLFVRVD